MKANYWGIMPATVRYDKRLVPMARVFYTELTALTQSDGCCTAPNSYFAPLYEVSEATVSKWVSSLAKCGHIKVQQVTQNGMICGRKIWLAQGATEGGRLPKEDLVCVMKTVLPTEQYVLPRGQSNNSSSKEEHVQSNIKEDFDRVWDLYGKKKDKAKSFTAYKNLTKKDRAACEAALPAYVKSTPDVQFRALLSTYIHGKRWEDDLTEGEQPAIQDEAPTVQLSEQWEASYQRFAKATGEAMADRAKMVKPLTRSEYVAWSTHTRRPLTGRLHKNNLHGKLLNWLKTNTGKMSTYKLQREIITMDALLFHTYTEILKESGRYGEFSESVAA